MRAFLSARAGGDEAMKTFVNTSLGETWMESGEAPDWRRLYDRRERWPAGTVPEGGLFLTAGADVQKDRIEVDVWAWGRGLESWLVDHVVIDGGPEQRGRLGRRSPRCSAEPGRTRSGAELQIARLAIDTGYEAPAVYAWARRQGFAQVAPVKGVEGFNRASPVSGPTYVDATDGGKRLRRGARLWTVAVSTFKAETYRFLRLERPTAEELAARRIGAAGNDPPAGLGRDRMAEAVRRRAAGHGEDEARLRPARMAEAPRAQRGARRPGLRPRRRLDRRRSTAGPRRAGPTWRRSSAPVMTMMARGRRRAAGAGPAGPAGCCAGAACARATWGDRWRPSPSSKARREALSASRASGVARVSYDGRTVDYRSLAEIDRAIEALDREIAAAEGRPIVRQVRVITTKGL